MPPIRRTVQIGETVYEIGSDTSSGPTLRELITQLEEIGRVHGDHSQVVVEAPWADDDYMNIKEVRKADHGDRKIVIEI